MQSIYTVFLVVLFLNEVLSLGFLAVENFQSFPEFSEWKHDV